MILYVDASAFAKRHMPGEPGSAECSDLMERHETWVTSRLCSVEVARALEHVLPRRDSVDAIDRFDRDLRETNVVNPDRQVCAIARDVAIRTGIKTLDAVHIASALTFSTDAITFLTYDRQQARAASTMGLRLAT